MSTAEHMILRQRAWLLRHGDGLTFAEVGRIIDRSREYTRQLVWQVEHRVPLAWRCNLPPSSMPAWWRRLRAANAFVPTTAWRYEDRWLQIPDMEVL